MGIIAADFNARYTEKAHSIRLGYVLEAILKENVVEYGHYRDTMVFAKLK
jgi:hypothetical protein